MSANVTWISHRGLKEHAPENTLAAFDAAVAAGFTVLETDLRLSADGHVVLHHDPTLTRLAGEPRPIATLTRVDLERLDLGGGHRLLFLDQFVERYGACSWVFDIKPETGLQVVAALERAAKRPGPLARLPERVRFVAWSAADEAALAALWPTVEVFARESQCWRAGLAVILGAPRLGGIVPGRTYSLPPRLGPVALYTREKVAAFHRHGARVLAFLPDTEMDVAAAMAAGVDDVLTNGRIV